MSQTVLTVCPSAQYNTKLELVPGSPSSVPSAEGSAGRLGTFESNLCFTGLIRTVAMSCVILLSRNIPKCCTVTTVSMLNTNLGSTLMRLLTGVNLF